MEYSPTTLDELVGCLCAEGFCKAVFSSRASSHPARKVVISALDHRFKVETFEIRRCLTSVIDANELLSLVLHHRPLFKQIDLFFAEGSCHVRLSPEQWECSWTKTAHKRPLTHNRIKTYLFPEGEAHPFLVALGVMDRRGNVSPSMRRKFVQINAFLDAIHDLLDHLQQRKKPLRIVDAGCGKGYLTFAVATFLNDILGVDAEVIGIDSRDDVISQCRAVRDQIGLRTLDFRMATVGSLEDSLAPDLLIALHACNTATDVALFKAVQWGTEAIAVAPCCQHELAPMIPSTLFSIIFDHPIFAQKAASLLTDAFRCELLSSCGYRMKAIEFVDPDHTPKNILLKGVKNEERRPLNGDFCHLRRHLPSGILLERLLSENGLLL
jgi:hypothetical protein